MNHVTASHSQIEVCKEQTEVIACPPPLNSTPNTSLEMPIDASKSSMRESLHHAALNKEAQRDPAPREIMRA